MPATTRRANAEARHPIAVVAARTGLSPDVLRAWERRYQVVRPARATDGQRLYSDADVERLRWLRLVTEAGRNIGQVANLPSSALAKLVKEDAAARPDASPADEARVNEIIAAALVHTRAFDGVGLEALLRRGASVLGIDAFLQLVCAGVLHRIGDEWHDGRLSAAQEHLASGIVQQVVVSWMHELARTDGPRIVVATPSGERHAIGAASVGALAAAEGWTVVYLGADLPAEDIARSAVDAEARLVALSIVHIEHRGRLLAQLRRVRDALPGSVRVIAGGSGATAIRSELKQLGISVCETMTDFRIELGATG